MNELALSLAVAVTVEGIMEYGKTVVLAFHDKKYRKLVYYTASLALSILLCFLGKIDIYAALQIQFLPSWLGILLTGIFASRGTNYLSAFAAQLQMVRED